jgi:hypothetical protein
VRQRLESKQLAFVLAILAAVAALVFVLGTPISATVVSTVGGVSTADASSYFKLSIVLVILQLVSAAFTSAATVFIMRNKFSTAKKLLLVGGVVGLSAFPVSSILALGSYFCIGKLADHH